MPTYRITSPDGQAFEVNAPEGATQDQVLEYAKSHWGKGQAKAMLPKERAPVEDPGLLSSLAIGAGKTVDSVLDGMTQMYLGARGEKSALGGLKKTVDEKAEIYKGLQEVRPYSTAIGEALPSMAVPIGASPTLLGTAARMAAAGGIPGALEYGTADERLNRGVLGAAAGAAVPIGVAGVKTGKSLLEPMYASGRQAIAARTLNRVAGDEAANVATRLQAAQPIIPGSIPTAAQVARNGGVAALERSAMSSNPTPFTERAMEQSAARLGALRGIAKDDAAMAAAETAREAATKAIYEQADNAIAPVDNFFNSLRMRPQFDAAVKRAEEIAKNEGYTDIFFRDSKGKPTALLGAGAHYIKKALDEAGERGASTYTGQAGATAAGKTQEQFLSWLDKSVPEYALAKQKYAEMSKPINQMQIGKELLNRLEPALADHGALARETSSKYALALRNANQTAKTATGFSGATLRNTLTPDQWDTVTGIAQDLARKSNAQDLGRTVGSNTFQNLAMQNIAEQSGMPRIANGLLGLPGVSRATNWAYRDADEKIQGLLADMLLNPQQAGKAMTEAQKKLLANNPKTKRLLEEAAVRGGGLLGLSVVE
jgi:hypothetical protein